MVNILRGLDADSEHKDGAPLLSTVWTAILNLFSKIGFESKTPKSIYSLKQNLRYYLGNNKANDYNRQWSHKQYGKVGRGKLEQTTRNYSIASAFKIAPL